MENMIVFRRKDAPARSAILDALFSDGKESILRLKPSFESVGFRYVIETHQEISFPICATIWPLSPNVTYEAQNSVSEPKYEEERSLEDILRTGARLRVRCKNMVRGR
jgi:hypothetical protein